MTTAAPKLPAGMTPRLLDEGAAAAYCGMSPGHFREHVAKHVRPLGFGRRQLYDIRALDRYLDQRSGLTPPSRTKAEWREVLHGGDQVARS